MPHACRFYQEVMRYANPTGTSASSAWCDRPCLGSLGMWCYPVHPCGAAPSTALPSRLKSAIISQLLRSHEDPGLSASQAGVLDTPSPALPPRPLGQTMLLTAISLVLRHWHGHRIDGRYYEKWPGGIPSPPSDATAIAQNDNYQPKLITLHVICSYTVMRDLSRFIYNIFFYTCGKYQH